MGKVPKQAPANKESDYLKYEGRTQWWTCDPKSEAVLQQAETGQANYDTGVPLATIPELFERAVAQNGDRAALRSEMMPALKKGEQPPPPLPLNQWKTWTWRQYREDARLFAKACVEVGMEPFQTVNVFGFNSPEWAISSVGSVFAGGKVAGIYPSDNEEQVKYKSDHSDGVVAVVEANVHFDKFKAVADDLPLLKAIVTYGCEPGENFTTGDGRTIETYSWTEFIEKGRAAKNDDEVNERIKNVKPGHACSLIYTSGTTGNPKAVMISHDNIIYSVGTVLRLPGVLGVKNVEERVLSYLPLSHVAGMMLDLMGPLGLSANIGFQGWCSTNFARTYDLKRGTLVNRLQTVRPTVFLGVPRVWEKIMEKLKAVGASTKGIKKMLSTYAKKKAKVYTSTRQLGEKGVTPMNYGIAKFVLNKVKQKLGLDQAKCLYSGAAPLTMECIEYFGSLGLNLNECYGMSETCAIATWSTDMYHVWGSVGFENSGTEVKILNKETGEQCPYAKDLFHPTEAEQGELCFRGRNIMMGYMANPRLGDAHVKEIEQKNADAVDEKGWLHSGDKGTRDTRGMFKITGRYKELIIGAGGENIAPVPIEDEIKRLCPFVSNVMMVGNKRKFNVMLLTLKAVGATGELPGGNTLDTLAATFSTSKTITEAMEDKKFIDAITAAITNTNNNKEVVPSNAAKVQKFTILPRDFSVQTGELTATQKLKRGVVDAEFEPIINKMYEVEETYVSYSLAPTDGLDMGGQPEPVFEKGLSFNMNKVVEEAAAEAKE